MRIHRRLRGFEAGQLRGVSRFSPAIVKLFTLDFCDDAELERKKPTKWDWVDPMKDASAEILQIEAGLKSRTQALSERGYDAEQVEREIAAERKRELELGLDFRRPGSPAQAPGQGGAQNSNSENDGGDTDQETPERRSDSETDK